MRLSPSFDTKLPDFSPRPSIPLETVSLGSLKYSPPKLAIPEVKKPPLIHQLPVDSSYFFKQSAQPKPSHPTLAQPKIKIAPVSKPVTIHPQIPIKKAAPVIQPLPHPAPKLPPPEKPHHNNLEALKKVIQSVTKPSSQDKKIIPIKFTPPPPKPDIEAVKPYNLAPKPSPKSELKSHPLITAKPSMPVPKPAPLPEKTVSQNEPDIQDLISKELEKVISHPLQQPVIKNQPAVSVPKNVPAAPIKQPIQPQAPILTNSHFWDFFLIRVSPRLNPYKSSIRNRTILGVKTAGLVLLALGVFIIINGLATGISLNIIFEAISTLTISGILLFLGENLNMFFEPVNPYKVHEVV